MPDPPAQELTIDELARVTGTTVRNVRAHQSRGLLPPPNIRARTGYYGPEHVDRLRMIQAMQAEGFRLKAIERLLDRPGGAAEQIFNFGRTLLHSFGETTPEFATSSELEERFGGPLDPKLLRKAEKLGLVRSLGEERWEIRNPILVSAGEQLVAIGVPLSHALSVAGRSTSTPPRSPRRTSACSSPTCSEARRSRTARPRNGSESKPLWRASGHSRSKRSARPSSTQ
jgi:DNA-binding transcriptional MerR regulator